MSLQTATEAFSAHVVCAVAKKKVCVIILGPIVFWSVFWIKISEVHFGVYFRDSRGFVFCKGTARSYYCGRKWPVRDPLFDTQNLFP